VLFEQRFWPGIADGSVTVTFRRWKRRQVIAGRRYRTPAGFIVVDRVDVVDEARITRVDARRSGFTSVDSLRAALRGPPDRDVYRIQFHADHGPDERAELAAADDLSAADLAELTTRLDRLDRASSHGAWTRETLRLIESHPARRAGDLSPMVGRELQPFKLDVRKLKNLGLTISLDIGYELSPRGQAFLDHEG
jgi:hypothetical protein